jgi:hypothetical protein
MILSPSLSLNLAQNQLIFVTIQNSMMYWSQITSNKSFIVSWKYFYKISSYTRKFSGMTMKIIHQLEFTSKIDTVQGKLLSLFWKTMNP